VHLREPSGENSRRCTRTSRSQQEAAFRDSTPRLNKSKLIVKDRDCTSERKTAFSSPELGKTITLPCAPCAQVCEPRDTEPLCLYKRVARNPCTQLPRHVETCRALIRHAAAAACMDCGQLVCTGTKVLYREVSHAYRLPLSAEQEQAHYRHLRRITDLRTRSTGQSDCLSQFRT
jgi:hypothetical protein